MSARATSVTTPNESTPARVTAATGPIPPPPARARRTTEPTDRTPARATADTGLIVATPARAFDPRTLIATFAAWEDMQEFRKAQGNRMGALERAGGFPPDGYLDSLVDAEHNLDLLLVREGRQHPLSPWAKEIPGFGEHLFAVVMALLGGDPYVATPKQWFAGEGERKDGHTAKRELRELPPRVRLVSELWSYAGLNPEARRTLTEWGESPPQDVFLACGNRLLGAKIRLVAESVVKHVCAGCSRAITDRAEVVIGDDGRRVKKYGAWAPPPTDCSCATEFPYRAFYDLRRARYQDAVHQRPCRGKGRCGLDAGTPWRDGHKRQAAINQLAKKLLADMYDEAKRLHEARA